MTEEMIIQKIRSRDPAGLEKMMDQYIPYVSTVVWNILRYAMQPEDAEEVVSDVFMAAWNQPSDLQPGKLKPWLGAVARNRAKNKLRSIGQTLPLDEDVLELTVDSADFAQQAADRDAVTRAVNCLPSQDRELFLRHYYYAQSIREISGVMALNESTIKTRLRRCRMKLKEILTGWGVK